jgi:molecular chaperone HtpG
MSDAETTLPGREMHHFEAETSQILDLVIHSLYSDRQVFLRELLSNASDALDRARYESVRTADLVVADGEPGIRILLNRTEGTITVRDNGIGMTREEVLEHLGTIARSGTRAFAKAASESGGAVESLIGQFGVGFYSTFMVADHVMVDTLSALPGHEAVRWEATGGESYAVAPGTRTTRGTDVVLALKEDAREYLDSDRILEIVKKHSDFLAWPIRFVEGSTDKVINTPEVLWLKNPKDLNEDEYGRFYKHISGDWRDPAFQVHLTSDGTLQFHAILFVPEERPFDLNFPDADRGLRLYCRRVLVLEQASDLLPRYLRFVRGVVENADLDLNVSRELLQRSPLVEKLKTAITKRFLKRLTEVARDDTSTYDAFWEQFGMILKEGIHEDDGNRELLSGLLRFRSTADKGWRGLQQVVDEMPKDQEVLWYLTGIELQRLEKSPLLERFRKKGWEVLLMTDPVDEWVVMHLREFANKPLRSAGKGDFEDETDEDDPIGKEARTQAQPLVVWLKELLKEDVSDVRTSNRLTDSPSVLVDSDAGLGSNLERILRVARQDVPETKRILEINAEHPIVKNLAKLQGQGRMMLAEPLGRLLLDHARLAEGDVRDPSAMVDRLQRVMLQASAVSLATSLPFGTHPVPSDADETPQGGEGSDDGQDN